MREDLVNYSGPRIVINPSTFHNEKDAACVMMNEALRIVMEDTGFEPQSEPTDAQREFFSDTAYADDELQLRRTILARICTFDTSVEDPTDEQLQEAVEFLETVQEVGAPQNEWEQRAVQRLHDVLAKSIEAGRRQAERAPEPPVDEGTVEGAVGAGETEEETSTTQAPTTQAPTTQAPTTQAPTTQAPTTQAPTPEQPAGQAQSSTGQKTDGQASAPPTMGVGSVISFDSLGQISINPIYGPVAGDGAGTDGGTDGAGRKGGRRIENGLYADQSNKTGGRRHIEDGLYADQSNKTGGRRHIEDGLYADQSNKTGGRRRI